MGRICRFQNLLSHEYLLYLRPPEYFGLLTADDENFHVLSRSKLICLSFIGLSCHLTTTTYLLLPPRPQYRFTGLNRNDHILVSETQEDIHYKAWEPKSQSYNHMTLHEQTRGRGKPRKTERYNLSTTHEFASTHFSWRRDAGSFMRHALHKIPTWYCALHATSRRDYLLPDLSTRVEDIWTFSEDHLRLI